MKKILAIVLMLTMALTFAACGGEEATTEAGEYLMKPLREAFEANVLRNFKGQTKLLVSALNGSEAAVLGASALGWE